MKEQKLHKGLTKRFLERNINKKTYKEIGEMFELTPAGLYYYLKKFGLNHMKRA